MISGLCPISARSRPFPREDQADRIAGNGFTLVELMVVLFIIGLVAGLAVLSMPGSRGQLVDEAERFAGRVIAARDNAVLQSRPMSIRVNALGYSFEQRSNGEWQGAGFGPFEATSWRDGTRARISGGDEDFERMIFDPVGIASDDLDIVLARDGHTVSVRIDRNGEVRLGE